MKIYVASSWKNALQPHVVDALRVAGHEVYDFRKPVQGSNGFHWTDVEKEPRPWSAETYRRALAHPLAADGYALDMGAMKWCEACVLVLPAGRSASFELGWCIGAGKGGFVLHPGEEEPELMFREAVIVADIEELVLALAGLNIVPPDLDPAR